MFIFLRVLLGSVPRDPEVFSDPWITSHENWMIFFSKGASLVIILEEKPVLGDEHNNVKFLGFTYLSSGEVWQRCVRSLK